MSKKSVCLLTAAALWVGIAPARSQSQATTEAITEYREWMESIADFTRGVEFDENDVRALIQYWPELDQLGVMEEDETDETAADFARDVREVLADSEYQSWARGNALDPEDFLRKSMRVSTVFMVRQMEQQRDTMAAQRHSHQEMVEESCAQVDAETCAQMRAAMQESFAMGEAMMEAVETLPPPTAGELALLDRLGDELEAVMLVDEEDEGYGDYEDYDDYEDDEGEEGFEEDGG